MIWQFCLHRSMVRTTFGLEQQEEPDQFEGEAHRVRSKLWSGSLGVVGYNGAARIANALPKTCRSALSKGSANNGLTFPGYVGGFEASTFAAGVPLRVLRNKQPLSGSGLLAWGRGR